MTRYTNKKTNYTVESINAKVGSTEYTFQPEDAVMESKEPIEEDTKKAAYYVGMGNRFTKPAEDNYYKALNDLREKLNVKAADLEYVRPEIEAPEKFEIPTMKERNNAEDLHYVDDKSSVRIEIPAVKKEPEQKKRNNVKDLHYAAPKISAPAKFEIPTMKERNNAEDLHYVDDKSSVRIEIPAVKKEPEQKKHYNVKDLHYVEPTTSVTIKVLGMMEEEKKRNNVKDLHYVEPTITMPAGLKNTVKKAATPAVQKPAEKAPEAPKAQAPVAPKPAVKKEGLGFDENSPFWKEFVRLGMEFEKAKDSRKGDIFDALYAQEVKIHDQWQGVLGECRHTPDNTPNKEKLVKEANAWKNMWDKASDVRDCIEKGRPLPKWWQDIMAKQAAAAPKVPVQNVQPTPAPQPKPQPAPKAPVQPTPAPQPKPQVKKTVKKSTKNYRNAAYGCLTGLLVLAAVVGSFLLGSSCKKTEKTNTGKGVVAEKTVTKENNTAAADKVDVFVNNGIVDNSTTVINNGVISVNGNDGTSASNAQQTSVKVKPASPGKLMGNTIKNLPQPMTAAENRRVQMITGYRGDVEKRLVEGHTVFVLRERD